MNNFNFNESTLFNNNLEPLPPKPKLVYTDNNYFSNKFIEKNKTTNKYLLNLNFSDVEYLINNKTELNRKELTFSTGIFPFEDKFTILADSESSFENIQDLVENEASTYYWFDSSVPSHKEILQTKIIPWGVRQENIQVSYHFPAYSTNFEFNVKNVNTNTNINMEYVLWPRTDGEEVNNIEFNTTFSSFSLNIEYAKGEEAITSVNLEMFRDPNLGQIYTVPFEVSNVTRYADELQLEYFAAWGGIDYIDLEVNHYTSASNILNMEFSRVRHIEDTVNMEIEVLPDTVYPLQIEYIGAVHKDIALGLEMLSIQSKNIVSNIEFARVRHDNDHINLEVYSAINSKLNTNFEYSIDTVYRALDMEYIYVIEQQENMPLEIFTPYINYNSKLSFETLIATKVDTQLNIEMMRPRETKINMQSYVIPWGFNDNYIQVYHKGTLYEEISFEVDISQLNELEKTNLEADIVINGAKINNMEFNIEYININGYVNLETNITEIHYYRALPIEFKIIYNEDFIVDMEFDINIVKDYLNNLECNLSIEKSYELALEYIQKIAYDADINLEYDTVINMDSEVLIEYIIEKLNHNYSLGIEYFVNINHDFKLDLELFINTVNKSLNLEIDVLDLVYYFIRKGHNILPWCYSDGAGNWDTTINKNWNKQNNDYTTAVNGFINQIQDKGLNVPDVIKYSDAKLENWGAIIKGVNEEEVIISDKFLYYKSIDDNYTLVLGKRKRIPQETIELKKGENLIIWDGVYKANEPAMFNTEILPSIENELDNVQIWDQRKGEWKTLINVDHPLFFLQDVDGTTQMMPFILNIKVNNDTSFVINR